MDVLSSCALPVGIVRWQSPAPSLTIAVKATFALEPNGYATLAAQQEPLSLDRAGAQSGPNELEAASDFAPFKPRADVLLTGHARAPAQVHAIPVRFGVNTLEKAFFAAVGEPAVCIPLAEGYLRSAASPGGDLVSVRARAPWSPERAALAGARFLDAHGLPVAPLPPGFDYRIFNAAPLDQQLDLPPTTAVLSLEGLLPSMRACQARLPGIYPRVFGLPRRDDPRRSTPREIQMRCDTLWIDGDRALCTLTWRGVITIGEEQLQLIVALERHGQAQSWTALSEQIEGATHARAVEASELVEIQNAAKRAESQRPRGRFNVLFAPAAAPKITQTPVSDEVTGVYSSPADTTLIRAHESPQITEQPAPPSQVQRPDSLGTTLITTHEQLHDAAPVLPFRQDAPDSLRTTLITTHEQLHDAAPVLPFRQDAPDSLGPSRITHEQIHSAEEPVLPFRQDAPIPAAPDSRGLTLITTHDKLHAAEEPALPFRQEAPIPPAPDSRGLTLITTHDKLHAAEEPALPFRQEAPIPSAPDSRGLTLITTHDKLHATEEPVLPFRRGAPISSAPESSPPPARIENVAPESARMPLELSTAIHAEISATPAARAVVLERYGIGEVEWELSEQRQIAILDREASAGRADGALALIAARGAARGRAGHRIDAAQGAR